MSANILDGCAAEVTEFKIFFDPDNGLPSSPGTFTVYSKSSHVMLIGVKLNALCDASASTFEMTRCVWSWMFRNSMIVVVGR